MKIKGKLAAGHLTSAVHIHIDTDADGIVWLSGSARNAQEVESDSSSARGTGHLVSVNNHLTVKKVD